MKIVVNEWAVSARLTVGPSAFFLAAVLILIVYLPACTTDRTSHYTSLAATACQVPPTEIARVYATRDLGVEECPAVPPYRLLVVSSEGRSWVDLRRNNLGWSTEQRVVYAKDILVLGHFPNVGGSDVAEWRLDARGEPVALILRLRMEDAAQSASAGTTVSRLLVIGLSEYVACDLGLSTSNEGARRIADVASTICAAPLPSVLLP